MSIRRILQLLLVIFICASASAAHGDDGQNATVNSDTLDVHSSMSESSSVAGTLNKGDAVVVEFEIEKADGGWCQIRKPDAAEAMGYVPCRHLDIDPPAKQWNRSGAQGAGRAGSAAPKGPSEVGKRPYADIQVIMYMTDWWGYCRKARELLQNLGVTLIEYNIDYDSTARQELKSLSGSTSIPFIDVEGTYLRGYNERAIRQAVESKR